MNAIANHANGTRGRLRAALKNSALALAVTAGLGAGSAQAQTTTTPCFLTGRKLEHVTFPDGMGNLVPQITQGSLPAGSILRSVTINMSIDSSDCGDSWLSDFLVYFDSNPGAPGTAAYLQFGGNYSGNVGTVRESAGWSGADIGPPFSLSKTITFGTDWNQAVDLHDVQVSVGDNYCGSTFTGTVTLEYDVSLPAVIVKFGLPGNPAVIDQGAKTIAWTVPYGTNVTALAPTFTLSSGTCDKDNGGPTTYNFTNPVSYTVTDGATVNTYTVTVTVTPASSAKNILTFGPGALISGTNISWTVPFGTDVTNLAPTYSVSTFAAQDALFPSGTARNFTLPQTYTITAQDLSTQTYTVTVAVAPDESTVIWDVAGSGAWDHVTYNWRGQTFNTLMPFFDGKNVIFDKTAGGTITIASGMAPASTTVSASSGNYTFSGQPVTTGPLTKSGGGQLSLEVSPANFSSIVVQGGTIYFHAADHYLGDGSPITMGAGGVTVASGATIEGERAYMAGSLTMNGGTWWEDNGFGGSWTGPVYLASDSFFGRDGWCCNQTIFGNISGPGGFTFSTQYGAVLGLFGTNGYTGPTNVNSGMVACQTPAALGHTSVLNIAAGARVLLAYTGDQVVSSLILGGVTMPPGTYGSSNSTAANQNDTYFAPSGNVFWQSYTGTGTVTVVAASYATWAATNAPTGAAKDDYDGDGVSNGVEYVVGGTKDTNDLGKLPKISTSGGNLVFTFKRDQKSIDGTTAVSIEVGSDLVTWPETYAVPDGAASNNPGVTVVKDSPTTGFDTVTLTVPQGSGTGKFARLKVIVPTP